MTELRIETLEMPAASMGADNPLPFFRSEKHDVPVTDDGSIPAEEGKYLGWNCAHRVLPYQIQDGYDRKKVVTTFRIAVLENEHLCATFSLSFGGRLLSLFDKTAKRELLDRNPVFQPAQLALRNAWFSGGIEFNAPQSGHHYLTCSAMYVARVRGSQGEPVLRFYEWDRVKGVPIQIDFHLLPGSRFLCSRVRLVNPHDHEIPMYWWTNIAVSENVGTRVLCPAETAIGHFDPKKFGMAPMPMYNNVDMTYAHNMERAREFYFRIPDQQRRWVAAVEANGTGLVHTSTRRLKGRKVFYWGMGRGGRQWQEFLSLPGRSYIEIQAGLGRTQAEHLPMPAHASWEWTEAFGQTTVDPTVVHGSDWRSACQTIENDLSLRLPEARLEALDQEFATVTRRPAEEILVTGSGWGALERRRLHVAGLPDRIPAELVFVLSEADQRPWLELLERGVLPPADAPGHLMVQPEWRQLLEASLASGKSDHWLAWWHLGNMCLEHGDAAGAKKAWEKSLSRTRTGWALRNLAILAMRDSAAKHHDPERCTQKDVPSAEAIDLLAQAWEIGPKIHHLAIEYARQLVSAKQNDRLVAFIATVPADIRDHERIHILSAYAALHQGLLDQVEPLFSRTFATIAEGEVILTDIWFGYHEQRIAKAEGIAIDDTLRKRVRRDCQPPKNIEFRMNHLVG